MEYPRFLAKSGFFIKKVAKYIRRRRKKWSISNVAPQNPRCEGCARALKNTILRAVSEYVILRKKMFIGFFFLWAASRQKLNFQFSQREMVRIFSFFFKMLSSKSSIFKKKTKKFHLGTTEKS